MQQLNITFVNSAYTEASAVISFSSVDHPYSKEIQSCLRKLDEIESSLIDASIELGGATAAELTPDA